MFVVTPRLHHSATVASDRGLYCSFLKDLRLPSFLCWPSGITYSSTGTIITWNVHRNCSVITHHAEDVGKMVIK